MATWQSSDHPPQVAGSPRSIAVVWLVAGSLLSSACGSRLGHEEHVALNSHIVEASAAASEAPAVRGPGPAVSTPDRRGDGPEVEDPSGDTSDAGASPASGGATTGPVPPSDGAAADAGPIRTTDAGDGDAPAENGRRSSGGTDLAGPATLSPVTVGNIGTYSGVVGAILQTGQEGLQVWAAWANQNGGLGGHQVELLTADDAGDPARAQSLTRDMVENQGAIAMVSNFALFATASVRPYHEEVGVPVIGGDLLTFDWFESPMFFPHGTDFRTSTLGTVKLGADEGATKVGMLACSEVPPICELGLDIVREEAESSLGVDLVYTGTASLAQPDFTSECLAARDAGVDNFVLYMDGNSTRRIADSCANQGYTPVMATNSVAMTETVTQSPNTDGLAATSQLFPYVADDTPGAQEFQRAYQEFVGRGPGGGSAAYAWAAGRLAQKAAAAVFTEAQPTSQDVLAGLHSIRDETLGGLTVPLTFGPDGRRGIPPCFFEVRVRDGRFVAPRGSQQICL